MCGIFGNFNFNRQEQLDINFLKNATKNILNHRGPDHSGFWFDENKKIFLMHNKLSIQDLTNNSNQPMSSSNGRFI